ncbi:MAG: DUF1318 domain-containing protein [Nitrospiraceae bacterium]|nr:DUF1318 domain-containing protein [Nitrospiraceae bacterium]
MKRIAGAFLATIIIVVGCVNIPKTFEAHITIDIRHQIEQQAGSLLDFIEEESDSLEIENTDAEPASTSWLWRAQEALSPFSVAYAAELKSDSPKIREIALRLRERNKPIRELKATGSIGENNRGYLKMREPDKIEDADKRNEAQRLIAAENKDRKALHQEIARLNKDQEVSVGTVERIYAMTRLMRAKEGELVQLPPKGDQFDEFKASEKGKKLGKDCVPEAWVIIR